MENIFSFILIIVYYKKYVDHARLDQYLSPKQDQQTVKECFMHIHNPASSPEVRKKADLFLIDAERYFLQLLKVLIGIYETEDVPTH